MPGHSGILSESRPRNRRANEMCALRVAMGRSKMNLPGVMPSAARDASARSRRNSEKLWIGVVFAPPNLSAHARESHAARVACAHPSDPKSLPPHVSRIWDQS